VIIVVKVFEQVEHEFVSHLLASQLWYVGAEDPKPHPKTCRDGQLGDEAPLKEPGREAVKEPKLSVIELLFHICAPIARSMIACILRDLLQRQNYAQEKVDQSWIGTPNCEEAVLNSFRYIVFVSQPYHNAE